MQGPSPGLQTLVLCHDLRRQEALPQGHCPRPQRRHRRPADTAPRRRSNTTERRKATTPPSGGSVGFGYGVVKETVLAGLDRMGS